ncbi:MAG TPA: hypothetical protein VEB42_09830, partial [Chitinophagaceae bacterium]|nr:hypothetical protein [Chitinophagaceae bacterium]
HVHYKFNNDKDRTLTSRGVFEFRNTLLNDTLRIKPDVFFPFRPDPDVIVRNEAIPQKKQEKEDANRKVQTLATVEVAGKQKTRAEKLEEEYASGLFAGQGATFIVDDNAPAEQSLDVFHYLMGRVAGLRIIFHNKIAIVSWGRDEHASPPVGFLNEMVLDNLTELQGIFMADVAMIKVFNPPFLGAPGGRGAAGAIAVYTKKGNIRMEDIKGFEAATVLGYSPLREFYSPDYSKDSVATATDYRTTLYWNPFVFIDKTNRRVQFTFYNNDITSKIKVVLEGIDEKGKLIHIEKLFE